MCRLLIQLVIILIAIVVIQFCASAAVKFPPIQPSADSKIIYVSDSEGSDDNDCLSPKNPCKTIAAGIAKMREGYPDHVYLKRCDVFEGQNISGLKNGRSELEPSVITVYGEATCDSTEL